MKKQLSAVLYIIPVLFLIAAIVVMGTLGTKSLEQVANFAAGKEPEGQYFTLKDGQGDRED
ncbi:MAG: hypothetical protein LBJ12_00495 [Oscillospiraceae bacterium]|jgi:hypothetical protein|nr:hypothetical protein [Oscillospiraceae bacterium]